MRPTVGQILSGLALGAVAASMLVMPERFIGAEDVAVQGLVLQAPAKRMIVRAAPIRPQRVQRATRVKRPVTVVARPAPVTVAISRRVPVLQHAAPPPPPPAERLPPPEATAPPLAPPPAIEVASVSQKKDKAKKDKAKDDKRKEKGKKKRDDEDEDEGDEDRGDRDEDRHDDDDDEKHADDHD